MYDAIADAVPLAQEGKNRKKAVLVISDGNDTNSGTSVGELRQMIRESEVLVYALGVDGTETSARRPTIQLPPMPIPFPIPGRRPQGRLPPIGGGGGIWTRGNERVNAEALRQITDDTGGRTEIVRSFRDLDGATERIADELSKQYLPWLRERRRKGRPLARHPRRGQGPTPDRARATGICGVVAEQCPMFSRSIRRLRRLCIGRFCHAWHLL